MKPDLQDLMQDVTRLTQAGQLRDATALIQRLLNGGAAAHAQAQAKAPAQTVPRSTSSSPAAPASPFTAPSPWVLDGCVFEIDAVAAPAQSAAQHSPRSAAADIFTAGQHSHARLTRRYKLYVPPAPRGASTQTARPLVLMLHGCTQSADDFAAGTAMNRLAREQGFFVLYPEQSSEANSSRCWNWFKHNHQQRGRGEPALLASLTQTVMREHGIDPQRVYVAGLSAGGAMAAILGQAYPDLYAAVGVHSGLASGAARSLPEALAAMKSGAVMGQQAAAPAVVPTVVSTVVPTIVFHGDQDATVHPKNGAQVIEAQIAAGGVGTTVLEESGTSIGSSQQGRRYTRHIHHAANDQRSIAEHWVVHGAGHAWSGGSATGSYTDAQGPDASAEMLRFFLAHPRRS